VAVLCHALTHRLKTGTAFRNENAITQENLFSACSRADKRGNRVERTVFADMIGGQTLTEPAERNGCAKNRQN
jgi:hypothetical protein